LKKNISSVDNKNPDTLYKPTKKELLLFYIELNENHNIIVYDANYNADKTINEEEPVHTYWIRYSERGQDQELSYFQKHLVYGLELKVLDKEKETIIVKFVSYKKRKIYLKKSTTEPRYYAYMDIQGKISLLSKIFIQVESGTLGLPKVKYVELNGKEITTNKLISERIIP
jgi:hypothetical protein